MKIEAQSLNVVRSDKEVLRDVSFSVGAGQIYALLGGNGEGKSTTLLTCLGFVNAKSGRVLLDGRNIEDDLTSTRQHTAYLPESAALYEHLNAYENLDYFTKLAEKPSSRQQIDEALERVALDKEARARQLKGYSKGMRQKVAIALAILRDTDVLMLDEPTSGLDPSAIDDFHRLIRDLADQGKTLLMVTHDVYGACQVADRIGLLKSGVIVSEFTAENGEAIDTEMVHKAFSSYQKSANSLV